ncbi:uncharacterized protein LOC129222530 [Uloborus diversus]|uniref:uncharacterized protein LOC129222530 n=1 Tax=Uloborus diversus TaxID=327109 RepID=UPI00240A6F4C|nr:uncharacterized protein LOC129222530 [Uloborus diversus]
MKRSCPSEIVLFEADLQPLSVRRQATLVKYFNKLSSIDHGNKTARYLNSWRNNKRLKRNSPFSLIKTQQLIASNVEPHYIHCNINTCADLSNVEFCDGLLTTLNKKECVPELIRQLALEVINKISPNDITIYSDGSKMNIQAGSGTYITTLQEKFFLKQRNPDFCSVFRSELIAIHIGLEKIMCENNFGDLWILSDSKSSIQHLRNWSLIEDKTSLSILRKVKLIALQHKVHFQWIPSHVDIYGNELADTLAKESLAHPTPFTSELTYLELFSQQKANNKEKWLIPPSHNWYKGKRPGQTLALPCERQTNTLLSRLASGHLKSLTFSGSAKRFPICPKCQQDQASPQHILSCLGLDWNDIFDSPLLVSDFIRVNGFIDLV